MKAIVIGGGIGGAATACAMLREGVGVELYEQAEQFGEIGAGLQISANAVRVLEHLGVGAALREAGVAAEAVEFRDLHTELFSDAERLASAAGATGVDVELQTYPDSVHVFLLFAFLAEASSAIAHLGDFARNATTGASA